jgi:hypothetical protein
MNNVEEMVNQLDFSDAIDRKIILSLTGMHSQDSLRNTNFFKKSLGSLLKGKLGFSSKSSIS